MNRKRTILALDIATKTGWAIRTKDGRIFSGVWDLSNGKYDAEGTRFLYMLRRLNWVTQKLGTIDCVYFEDVKRHASHRARLVYFGYLTHVMSWAAAQTPAPPLTGCGVGTIKKYATGKGRFKGDQKKPMVEAAKKRGWKFHDDNEVDALFLLHLAIEQEE